MECLEEIIINEEIINYKNIRNLIDDIISAYVEGRTEPVNKIRELKQKNLKLLGYARTIVILYEENEDEKRKIKDKIYEIENEICKIEENISSKDKSYNLIEEYFDEILSIIGKYIPKKGKYQKLNAYLKQNGQSPTIYS